jgi:uncharacterized protein YciI
MFVGQCGTRISLPYEVRCKIAIAEDVMLFVVIGHDAPDAKEKRPQHRLAHLEHLAVLSRQGRIPLAGPFTDGTGSLIVLEAESRAAAWAIVGTDPYVVNGVFNKVEVKPFKQVFPEPRE